MTNDHQQHTPVLCEELTGVIRPSPGELGVDCTLGGGGHARALLTGSSGGVKLVGIDVDPAALEAARKALRGFEENVTLVQANFGTVSKVLAELGIGQVNFLYADLGTSALQLACPERGFSFGHDGPLDMRMDPSLSVRAADLVNGLKEQELGDLIFKYGQEKRSRKIARLICQARRRHRLDSTTELGDLICQAMGVDPKRLSGGRIHPATKTFQALRIAVNDELGQLRRLLEQAPELLAEGARLAVISFHSLEDALVKRDFRDKVEKGVYRLLTKRPITASPSEMIRNPRARSAKLRAAEKAS